MGFWDKVKKGIGAVGDVAKKAAPFTAFIPVVGPVAAGLIGAGGALAGKLNDDDPSLGGALGEMAGYGGAGYLGAKAFDKMGGAAGGLMGGGSGAGAGGGGSGMGWQDWATLGTGVLGAGAGAYGAYKEGQAADADIAEGRRRYDLGFAEDRRRYDQDFGFAQKRYGDERADVAFGRDQRRRSGVALNPMVRALLNRGAVQMES